MDNARDEELINILKKLANEKKLTETIKQYTENFRNIYEDGYRHKYSDIHSILLVLSPEERDYLSESLRTIFDETSKEFKSKEKIKKLWDHIQLENMRSSELREYANIAKSFTDNADSYSKLEKEMIKRISTAQSSVDNLNSDLHKIKEDIKNSGTQSITILGIFSGIVMAFTGGLSFIASSLQNINAISMYRLVFVILILGVTIFNIIFMLIYTIGKITGIYIGSKCNCKDPVKGCNEKSNECTVVRYPLVSWVNISIAISLGITFVMYVLDKYNIFTRIKDIFNLTPTAIISILSIMLIIGLILVYLIFRRLIKISCKYEVKKSFFSWVNNIFPNYRKK